MRKVFLLTSAFALFATGSCVLAGYTVHKLQTIRTVSSLDEAAELDSADTAILKIMNAGTLAPEAAAAFRAAALAAADSLPPDAAGESVAASAPVDDTRQPAISGGAALNDGPIPVKAVTVRAGDGMMLASASSRSIPAPAPIINPERKDTLAYAEATPADDPIPVKLHRTSSPSRKTESRTASRRVAAKPVQETAAEEPAAPPQQPKSLLSGFFRDLGATAARQ